MTDEAWLTQGYYTVVIPPCSRPTQWHAPDRTLTRGAFPTEAVAQAWVRTHILGCPYEILYIPPPKGSLPFDLDGFRPGLSRASRSGTLPLWARPRRSR